MSLTANAKLELRWWIAHLRSWNGLSFLPEVAQEEIFTDSSLTGYGIVWNNTSISQQWDKTVLGSASINYLELLTIWKVLQIPELRGKVLRIYCDNTTSIAYVKHYGGTRSDKLMDLAAQIWRHCFATGTRLVLTYIPSALNPADPPSRNQIRQLEWALSPATFSSLNQLWGPLEVNCFASASNHKLPRYMSWTWDPHALGTDALSLNWARLGTLYLCPPWNLLLPVVHKVRLEKCLAVIITPNWPSAIWYPLVSQLAIESPIQLDRTTLVSESGLGSPLQANSSWTLLAWEIQG